MRLAGIGQRAVRAAERLVVDAPCAAIPQNPMSKPEIVDDVRARLEYSVRPAVARLRLARRALYVKVISRGLAVTLAAFSARQTTVARRAANSISLDSGVFGHVADRYKHSL